MGKVGRSLFNTMSVLSFHLSRYLHQRFDTWCLSVITTWKMIKQMERRTGWESILISLTVIRCIANNTRAPNPLPIRRWLGLLPSYTACRYAFRCITGKLRLHDFHSLLQLKHGFKQLDLLSLLLLLFANSEWTFSLPFDPPFFYVISIDAYLWLKMGKPTQSGWIFLGFSYIPILWTHWKHLFTYNGLDIFSSFFLSLLLSFSIRFYGWHCHNEMNRNAHGVCVFIRGLH